MEGFVTNVVTPIVTFLICVTMPAQLLGLSFIMLYLPFSGYQVVSRQMNNSTMLVLSGNTDDAIVAMGEMLESNQRLAIWRSALKTVTWIVMIALVVFCLA